MKFRFKPTFLVLIFGFVSNTQADKYNADTRLINASTQSSVVNNLGVENSSVTIDFSVKTAESWDAINDSSNVIANCIQGNVLTGLEWSNVVIETVGSISFLSEASFLLSDSNGDNGIELTLAIGDEFSGAATYSSENILDFTDMGISDISSLADNQFPIQFYEAFDDINDAVEANFKSGTLTFWGQDLSINSECEFIATGNANLKVELESDASSNLRISDHVNFTITIENIGDALATNIVLSDTISGLQFIDAICDDGSSATYSNQLITMNVDDIAAGNTLVCEIDTQVINYGELSYRSSVLADNDIDNSNNSVVLIILGPSNVIPVNNLYTMMFLILLLLVVARKKIT